MRLVLSGRQHPPFDAQLFHGAREAEAIHDDADGADDARLVDVDPVGRDGDVIPAGGRGLLDHRVDRYLRMQRAQPQHFVIDLPGLHRTAAGTVDAQDQPLDPAVLHRGLHALDDPLRARAAAGLQLPADLDQRGALVEAHVLAAAHDRQGCDKTQTDERQGCEAKEDSPAAIATTLGQEILGELFEQSCVRRKDQAWEDPQERFNGARQRGLCAPIAGERRLTPEPHGKPKPRTAGQAGLYTNRPGPG